MKQQIQREAEEARKQGLIEAKKDPEMLMQMRLAALKKAEEFQMLEENNEIKKLSQQNEEHHKK